MPEQNRWSDLFPSLVVPPVVGNVLRLPLVLVAQRVGIDGSGEFGFRNMKAGGSTLDVKYSKGSSAPSCTNCSTSGGGQFHQNLGKNGYTDLRNATQLFLKYDIRFPSGFDFGLGGYPGEASRANHGQAWSTRFMFRDGSKGEVYG